MTYIKTLPRFAHALTRWTALLGLLAVATAQAQPAGQPQNLPKIALNAGMHVIQAQVAMSPQERQVGLMFRREMPANEGMLFVFEEPAVQCFWMRNTLLPLAVAFVTDDGTIVNVDEMKPQSDDSHCSKKPVRYVLEMNTGWFAKRAIGAGFKLSGRPFAK